MLKITPLIVCSTTLAGLCMLGAASPIVHAAEATTAPAHVNTAIVPAPRDVPLHRSFVELAKKGDIDVLFLGDSITDWWREENAATNHNGKQVFDKYFGQLKVANFGIASDTTGNVLWRLQNGEGEGFQPKVVMLMIGTNNLHVNTNPEVVEGITAVVHELRQRFPAAKILLLGIFPRDTAESSGRSRVKYINESLSALNDLDHIFFLDIGQKFIDEYGNIPLDIMSDGLHPTAKGYEIWAQAIKEPLANLLKLASTPTSPAPATTPKTTAQAK